MCARTLLRIFSERTMICHTFPHPPVSPITSNTRPPPMAFALAICERNSSLAFAAGNDPPCAFEECRKFRERHRRRVPSGWVFQKVPRCSSRRRGRILSAFLPSSSSSVVARAIVCPRLPWWRRGGEESNRRSTIRSLIRRPIPSHRSFKCVNSPEHSLLVMVDDASSSCSSD